MLRCALCSPQIASNRYAPHLSSCIGLGTGTRRGAARGNVKSKFAPMQYFVIFLFLLHAFVDQAFLGGRKIGLSSIRNWKHFG